MPSYHDQLALLAKSIGSDGCTHGMDICIECCWEHDWTYVTGLTPQGRVVDKEYADRRFRDCLQAHMSLRWLNPLSWWRYLAVVKFGHGIWGRRPVEVQRFYTNYSSTKTLLNDAQSARLRIFHDLNYSYEY